MKTVQSFICSMVALSLAACGSGSDKSHHTNGLNVGATHTNHQNQVSHHSTTHIKTDDISKSIQKDQSLYSVTHSWKVMPPPQQLAVEVQKAVADTNRLRAQKGLPALKYDERLSAYAQRRAEEITRLFKHDRLTGQSFDSGMTGNGVAGENIAAGTATSEQTVLGQWKNSSGHYANMVDRKYTKIGMGLVYVPNSQYGYYWVQILGDDAASSNYYFDSSIAPITDAQSLTQLKVGAVEIPLVVSGHQWQKINTPTHQGMVSGDANSRFGVIKHQSGQLYQTFYQGHATQNMPQSGSARYVGQAVMVDGQVVDHQLTSQFDVDFKNKNLKGSLYRQGQNVMNLNADITGNTFHSKIGANVETHGGFFGDRAVEISGDFREHQTGKIGAFGARKQ